MNHKKTFLCTS